jgi:iron complex outermembrane receptor protein
MNEKISSLDQVVVVGYGTQKVKNISGAVAVLGEKDFNTGVVQTAADLLQGKIAGLTITTGSGDVTSEQTMRLRGVSSLTGSSSPFVVIDGVPGMDLNSVAPQDIQSISVLKDASAAAIYGSRSASGVILITTKKGNNGQSRVQFNSYVAADVVANKPEVLTASDWRDYTSKEGIDVSGLDKGGNTDWFKEIMRTGISQNHFLSVSGGGENSNYRASLNYLNRKGIMKDNSLERYNALFSINQKALRNKLNISLTIGTVQGDLKPSNSYNSSLAYNMVPVYPVKNADGSWFETLEYGQGNPVHNIAENKYLNKTNLLYSNLKTDLDIFKDLTVTLNLFKQRKTNDQSTYEATTTEAGRGSLGYAYRANEVWDKDLIEFTTQYSKKLGESNISLLAGYSYEDNYYQSESAQNRGFISDVFGYNNLSAGESLFPNDVNSYRDMSRLISYFGRVNYSLFNKYIFTGTFRRDGSSIFGKNNKWATFPSASIAWRISQESFMDHAAFINELKLRIGYGIVGNQDGIGPYNSIALYGRSDEYWDNGHWRNSYKYSQNANPDLKWEQTASFNPGIDYSLFRGRLNGSIDYYVKRTSNLLYTYSVPVPPNLYPTMLANVGDMSNKGFEILVNGDVIQKKDFQWTISLNFAHNKNRVTKLSNDIYSTSSIKTGTVSPRGSSGTTSHIIEEGQEVGTFYGWKSLGLDEEGKYIILDVNEDGEINNLDRTYIGHALPKMTYGISNTITYKKFTFNFFLRGIYGNDVLNNPSLQYGNIQWLPGSNVLKSALTNGIHDSPKFSSYYIEKGSFLRLDNMSLSYDFAPLSSWGVNACRIYCSAQNLFIITGYKGLDPEVNMGGLAPGVEEAAFIPKSKTFSFGINVSF